jgi:hypothetical protein
MEWRSALALRYRSQSRVGPYKQQAIALSQHDDKALDPWPTAEAAA